MSLPLDHSSLHSDASLETLEKQLICPICLEVFTKPVVILPCEHNLCRKCANELYQPSLFQVGFGGRFRCPTCRYEVVLDRHGVYGLQRNLLVENIIDVYKQVSASPSPKPPAQVTCEDHEGEKLNIYCITCQIPTCSLCKVFGPHASCQVSPLSEVYQQQKAELNDEIGSLVANNECIQAYINDLEETCRNIEVNGTKQKQEVSEKFDHMCAILEERRKMMLQQITYEQDEKNSWAQSLVHTYSEHVNTNSKLVQTAVNSIEEQDMAAFLQTSKSLIETVKKATNCTPFETLQPEYEKMDHYKLDFNATERALHQLDFMKTEEQGEEVTEALEPEPEPESEQSPQSQLESQPETEPGHETSPSQPENNETAHNQKSENCEVKKELLHTKENICVQPGRCAETKKDVLCEKGGLNTQQAIIHILYVLAFLVILQRVWGSIQCLFCL